VLTGAIGAVFALWVQSSGDWRVGLPWERTFLLSLDRTAPVVIDWVMLGLPWLGTNLTLLPILSVVSLWLWRKKGRGDLALHLVMTAVGSLILTAVLKDLFSRPRPELWPHRGQYAWAAFPSGHAIVGMSVYFTVARMLHHARQWRWPFALAALLLVVNLYSRLYLGVHWPTDVLGGLIVGVAWLYALSYAFGPLERRQGAREGPPPSRTNPTGLPRRSTMEGAEA
jgi:membrane-associated phospholipid phosphatase